MIVSIAKKITYHFVAGFFFLLLASCGGGGGGSASSVNGGIEVTPSSIDFTAIKDVDSQVSKSIAIKILSPDVAFIAGGYPQGMTPPTWLQVNITGAPPFLSLELTAFDSGLEAGTYTTTLRIATAAKNESLIGYLDVPVTFNLKKQLGSAQKEINFDYVMGATYGFTPIDVSLYGKGIAWSAKVSEPWVTLNLLNGVAPSRVAIGFNPSGLVQGNYSATVSFTPTDGSPPFDIKVQVHLSAPTLQWSNSSLGFAATRGGQENNFAMINIASTGGPLSWTATSDQSWVRLSPAAGTAQNGFVNSTSRIDVGINIDGLALGEYSGVIKITDQNGGVYVLPVTLSLIAPQLIVGSVYSSFIFEAVEGSVPPPSQTLGASSTGTQIDWAATTNQPWLKLSSVAGTTPSLITVSVDQGKLVAGTYIGLITVNDKSNANYKFEATLKVNAPGFNFGSNYPLEFYGINGGTIEPKLLEVQSNNGSIIDWTAVSNAPWLKISKGSGKTPDSIQVSIDPAAANLSSGQYSSTITFDGTIDGKLTTAQFVVNLQLTVPTLGFYPNPVVLGGHGGHIPELQPVYVDSTYTGFPASTPINWKVSASNSWIKPDRSTGISRINPNSTTPNLKVGFDATGLSKGNYSGSLDFIATVNGDTFTATLPVTFVVDEHRLQLSENGVALTSTTGLTQLSRTVTVKENFGGSANWTAKSDQPWLTVTGSGKTAGDLVITANPVSLAQDKVHFATVTVSSSDPQITNSEKINVGLWVGSTSLASTLKINTTFTEVETDPVRPYVYAHSGGTDITIINVYTGAEVNKIKSVAPLLGDMLTSNDGSRLYVVDRTNSQIIPINLETLAVSAGWQLAAANLGGDEPRLEFLRTNGLGAVIASDGVVYNALSGARLLFNSGDGLGSWYRQSLAAAREAPVLFSFTTYSNNAAIRTAFDYSYANGLLYGNVYYTSALPANNSLDLAVKYDGTRVYNASEYVVDFQQFNGVDIGYIGILPGSGIPNNMLVGRDGRVFGGASLSSNNDVWVYDQNGFVITSLRVAGQSKSLLRRQLVQSGDGLVLIALTNDPTLQMIPINF